MKAAEQINAPQQVDPLSFPLYGNSLIEASAGTGKTYTIAALYLRLVLGAFPNRSEAQSDDQTVALPEPARKALIPPDILVMTFTDAATKELRDRIRARLSEAAAFFRAGIEAQSMPEAASEEDGANGANGSAESEASAGDGFLQGLQARFPKESWPDCATRLQLAAEWMDEAAIFTIHGWCQRMLSEHAFDSGSMFNQTLATDTAELLAEACRDYWRVFCYPLNEEEAQAWRDWWQDPATLQQAIAQVLPSLSAFDTTNLLPPAECMAKAKAEAAIELDRLKAPWRDGWIEEIEKLLAEMAARKEVNGQNLKRNSRASWISALRSWVDDAERKLPHPTRSNGVYTRLNPAGMRETWKAASPMDSDFEAACDHPAFRAMSELLPAIDALPDGKDGALMHAATWVAERLHQAKQQQGLQGFDDLLHHLRDALNGPGGQTLAARIRQQYPIALIDEFQDTDPIQYDIFDKVYRLSKASSGRATSVELSTTEGTASVMPDERVFQIDGVFERDTGIESCMDAPVGEAAEEAELSNALILIGDPKQAIYAFRGADIFTYLRARHATEGRHFTLGRNYRASTAMVDATNHLFHQPEKLVAEGGKGAFRFAQAGNNPVPFIRVEAQGRQEHWWDDASVACRAAFVSPSPAPALTIWYPDDDDPAHDSKNAYVARYARATADEISRLLKAGQRGQAGFGEQQGVKPADIAVLVHTGMQADAVREALMRHGIRSVYLSEQGSVFESRAVEDLLRWLRACANPGDGRLLRAALGTSLSFLSMETLLQLTEDERVWERYVAQFQRYRMIWRRQGVLPMLRLLLQDFEVASHLLAEGRERELTDLLHLSELLQKASVLLKGEQALIRYLLEGKQAADREQDERRLRLESDDERVKIVTVHKSKGLEYPLVFFPFACHVRPARKSDTVLRWHDETGRLQCQLGGDGVDAELLEKVNEEQLGEDLRKLYVALTRARHATWIGLAALDKELPQSAIGYLLGIDQSVVDQSIKDASASVKALDAAASGSEKAAAVSSFDKAVSPGKRARRSRKLEDGDTGADAKAEKQAAQTAAWKAAVRRRLDKLLDGVGPEQIRLAPLPEEAVLSAPEVLDWEAERPPLVEPLTLTDHRWPYWWIASYSSLTAKTAAVMVDEAASGSSLQGWEQLDEQHFSASAQEDRWAEQMAASRRLDLAAEMEDGEGRGVLPSASTPVLPLQDFPRGPQAGTFLHGLLEWAAREGFASLHAQPERLDDAIERRLRRLPAWAPWQPMLQAWLKALIGQTWPLAAVGSDLSAFCLATLRQYQVEMEFMLPVNRVPITTLDRWVCRHTLDGAARPALTSAHQLNGMLKGFIDLVFEHEGRYFVLDYKSNWLGTSAADYSRERMQAAVLEHRYDVQYLFYCLALHRLLKNRVPDYDYDRHMGGAVYLFLRGLQGETGGVFHERPPRWVIERLDAVFAAQATLEEA
ncbi:MAG: UvrD-helicase domain-containing protein [Lautropia sp.]|nr:UvrD-helicase domain-containing protein [Lautropia sp.]